MTTNAPNKITAGNSDKSRVNLPLRLEISDDLVGSACVSLPCAGVSRIFTLAIVGAIVERFWAQLSLDRVVEENKSHVDEQS
jgi:hypothetical protein